MNFAAAPEVGYPFSLVFKNQKPATDVNNVLYRDHVFADGLELTFEYSDGKVFAQEGLPFSER